MRNAANINTKFHISKGVNEQLKVKIWESRENIDENVYFSQFFLSI